MTKQLIKQELIIYIYDYNFINFEKIEDHSLTLRKKTQSRLFSGNRDCVDSFSSEFLEDIKLPGVVKGFLFDLKKRQFQSNLENEPLHWNYKKENSFNNVKNKKINKYELLKFKENSFFIPRQELTSYYKTKKNMIKNLEERIFINRDRYQSSYSSIPICKINWTYDDITNIGDDYLFKW